jgi:hypothetical protein
LCGEGQTSRICVFISYRRQETSGLAGRLYDRLAARLGDDQVFMANGVVTVPASMVRSGSRLPVVGPPARAARRGAGHRNRRRASARRWVVTVTCWQVVQVVQVVQVAAGVGAVTDQVDAASGKVLADQPDQVAAKPQPPGGVVWPPQAGQDGQAHRPATEGQVDQHAQDHPGVGPGARSAPAARRVVVPGGPNTLRPLQRYRVSTSTSRTGALVGTSTRHTRSSRQRPS